MQTGLKRAEQAQPSSPARGCRCDSREWEEADRVARSRALCAEFQTPPSGGLGARRAWRRGGSGRPRPPDSRPRGPGEAAAPPPRPPGRADPTTGYFCGAPGWNPGRAASAGARETPRTDCLPAIGGLAPERKSRTRPPGAPRKDPGRHSPPQGPRRGPHRLPPPPPAGRAPAPSPCPRRPRAGPARPPGNATGRGACAPGAGPAEGRPPDSGLRNARRPLPAPGASSGKTSGCAQPGVLQRHL